jgi:membrane protein implicated in regulation of membrane protease activity
MPQKGGDMGGIIGADANPVWFWLAVLVILLIAEFATVGLTTIWFAGGAAVALICAAAHVLIAVQILLFAGVSVVLLVLFRPLALKRFNRRRTATNVDSLIGMKGVVKEDINNIQGKGRVEVRGMDWAAASADENDIIEKNTEIRVQAVEGVTLKVCRAEHQNPTAG